MRVNVHPSSREEHPLCFGLMFRAFSLQFLASVWLGTDQRTASRHSFRQSFDYACHGLAKSRAR
jgi:hypothetical protein